MLRLVNKIPDNTKNVLIHLRYFFINIIIPPNFYKNLIIYDVFGAPSYVLNNEIFWGQDRLDYLEDALNKQVNIT